MSRPPRAPTLGETLLRESLTGRELIRLPLRSAALARAPRGAGRPVLLLPGLSATDASLRPLGEYLGRLGHRVHPLGLGRIHADVRGTLPGVIDRIRRIADSAGDQVALVGQSLGGVLAREAARQEPRLVRRIITFGSPVVGGPEYTATRSRYTAAEREAIRRRIAERNRVPVPVPITAVWSKNDGIVSPAACVEHDRPGVEHVEVRSSHLGMGLDPDVWLVVARRLAPE